MIRLPLALCGALLYQGLLTTHANATPTAVSEIQTLVDSGQYSAAKAEIQRLNARAPIPELAFEAERMARIEREFTLDEAALRASVQSYLPDATEAEISQWLAEGRFEAKQINGETRYFKRGAYNLIQTDDAAAKRAPQVTRFTDKGPLYRLHDHHKTLIEQAQPLRQRIRVSYSLTVDADAVPAGETLTAWLPFPKALPGAQEQVALLSASPAHYQLAPNSTAQRTIAFSQEAQAGKPTRFEVQYAFDSLSRGLTPKAQEVRPLTDEEQQALAPYLGERPPHIQFTPALIARANKAAGLETNPYRIAQKLFADVDQIPWASAREYSTIRNISEYAHTQGRADCGQQTLLLMTLMRIKGIPTRWQSGWEFGPGGFDTMHDWAEFYLAPYGWLPMDVTHGQLASNDPRLQWFYLGRLDAFRLIFNTDYSQPFVPAKRHFRSETVDSQRGEVEWRGGNLYFDQWDYSLTWEQIDTP
ncbi:transglutaminase-like domain-containing protein [Simiduia sp. 21SJ11W-1]|uniref:transglutaminase-like domain-containing protein n=1 Tax=Simiduia sp. 21SJ11W-1 TaxID=2909669 RepID=UPI00209F56DF|nr:transglutaminase-like domain-containing protein [Simiduia sp. 21SJ11W-1]UTA48403.1 transglutaminase-like domain-containing protein [Simiduia sp. 21SJ11W-1]